MAQQSKPKPDAHFGNVQFKTPVATLWKRSEQVGRLVFSAPVPPPDFCTLTVFPGTKLSGDFKRQFEEAVQAELKRQGVLKVERDGGVQESIASEGFPVLQKTIVCETKDFHTVHWFLAGNSGDRFDMIGFQTSGEETFKLREQDAVTFFFSVKLTNSLLTVKPVPVGGALKVGDRVDIFYDERLYGERRAKDRGTIVEVGEGKYKIRYLGCESYMDSWEDRRLVRPAATISVNNPEIRFFS